MTAIKPLYKQEVHHFNDLCPTSKALESQVITVHWEMKSQVFSLQLRERQHCFSNLLQIEFMCIYEKIMFLGFFEIEFMCIYEKMFLGFFDLKLPK